MKGFVFLVALGLLTQWLGLAGDWNTYWISSKNVHGRIDFENQLSEKETRQVVLIEVEPSRVKQSVLGVGASLTESTAFVLAHLSPKKRRKVLEQFFGEQGAKFSMSRTHIGSCDFSVEGKYDFRESQASKFSLHQDLKGFEDLSEETLCQYPKSKIRAVDYDLHPLIAEVFELNPRVKLIASAWTAPPWMTSIAPDYYREGHLDEQNRWVEGMGGRLTRPRIYAEYLIQYLDEMKKRNTPIWGLTPVNEPMGNNGAWESMNWSAVEQASWLRDHYGPLIQASGHSDVQMILFDQNKKEMNDWVAPCLANPASREFFDGVGYHWYNSTSSTYPEALEQFSQANPNKWLIHTEGCVDDLGTEANPHCWDKDGWQEKGFFDNRLWWWEREATDWGYAVPWAEASDHPKYSPVHRYVNSIIDDFNHGAHGWVDWNMVLDQRGGPNHVGNFCGAPVMVDLTQNDPDDGVFYTPVFAVMKQLSWTLQPCSQVLESRVQDNIALKRPHGIKCISTKGSDGECWISIFNPFKKYRLVKLVFGTQWAYFDLPAEALITIKKGLY